MSDTIVIIQEVSTVELSAPGPQGATGATGAGVPAGGTTGQVLKKNSDTDYDTSWQAPGAAPTASQVDFTPAGSVSATDVQAAIEEVATEYAAAISALSSVYQPLDGDLTSIAALTTTAFGRSLLTLADQAALLSAAGAQASDQDLTDIAALTPTNDDVLQRKAGAWTNRTLAQLASDLGLATSYQPLDSDLTAIAALTTTAFGRGLLTLADAAAARTALSLAPGTDIPSLATFNDHSARHENGGADEISIAGLDGIPAELQNHLDDTTDAHDASAISIADAGTYFTSTDVEGALQEIGAGGFGGASALVDLTDVTGGAPNTGEAPVWDGDSFELTDVATQAELDAHLNDTTDAHDASAISYAGNTNLSSTDVEAALDELDNEKQPLDSDLTAIAALATTSFGRALLALADPADATKFLDGTGAYDTVKDSDLSTSDITTNNVSTTKHGFAPKLPNDATKYLDGTGAYSVPAGSGGAASDDESLVLHVNLLAI